MSLVARVFYGLPDVRAYLSNKTSAAKLRLMQFFGLDMCVKDFLILSRIPLTQWTELCSVARRNQSQKMSGAESEPPRGWRGNPMLSSTQTNTRMTTLVHESPGMTGRIANFDTQNWKSHIRWTGPQILRQLPEIDLLCAGMGTSGEHRLKLAQSTTADTGF